MDGTNLMNTMEELDNRISYAGLTTSTDKKQAIPQQSVVDEEPEIQQLIHYLITA